MDLPSSFKEKDVLILIMVIWRACIQPRSTSGMQMFIIIHIPIACFPIPMHFFLSFKCQGDHWSGKSQGKFIFLKKSGKSQGILKSFSVHIPN